MSNDIKGGGVSGNYCMHCGEVYDSGPGSYPRKKRKEHEENCLQSVKAELRAMHQFFELLEKELEATERQRDINWECLHACSQENNRLRSTLEQIEQLGHSTHHARGYTLANIAAIALTVGEEVKGE